MKRKVFSQGGPQISSYTLFLVHITKKKLEHAYLDLHLQGYAIKLYKPSLVLQIIFTLQMSYVELFSCCS